MPDANITKSALARALKKLMAEKDFQKISVTDICEKCGMNRKSFYYHFKDKYDLMNWIFYTEFITMVTTKEMESGWDLLRNVMEMFYGDRSFYLSAIQTEGQNSFTEYFHESMIPIISFLFDDIVSENGNGKMLVHIFADACLLAALRWLEDGCPETPEVFVENLKKLIKKIASTI